MTGTTKRLARLAVAVIFVVPVIVGSLATTSTAAPSKADVERAEAKAEEIGARLEVVIEQYNEARVQLNAIQEQARRHARREGEGRRRGRGRHRRPRSPCRRGVHRLRFPARRAARCPGLHRILRPARVHGRGRPERRRPRRRSRQRPATRRVGRRRSTRRPSASSRTSSMRWTPSAPASRTCSPNKKRSPTSSTRSTATTSRASRQRRSRRGRRRPEQRYATTERHPADDRPGWLDPATDPPPCGVGASAAIAAAQSVHRCPVRLRFGRPQRRVRLLGPHDVRLGTRWRLAAPLIGLTGLLGCRDLHRRRWPPGDLLFFYSPISHVALYIGGGMMIHARHPGPGGRSPVRFGVRVRHTGRARRARRLTRAPPPPPFRSTYR